MFSASSFRSIPIRQFSFPRSSIPSNNLPSVRRQRQFEKLPTEQEQTAEQKVRDLLSKIFSSAENIDEKQLKQVQPLCMESTVRAAIAHILLAPRTQGSNSMCLTIQSFNALGRLVHYLLDSCVKTKDYQNGRAVLEAGNVFYTEDTTVGRVYLENRSFRHSFWLDLNFWRSALMLELSEKAVGMTSEQKQKIKSHQTHVYEEVTHDKHEQDEFILQWMISAAHHML